MKHERLFVGGPMDGKRLEVKPGMERVYIPHDRTWACYERPPLTDEIYSHEYRLYRLSGTKQQFEVYSVLTVDEVLEVLIDSYGLSK